MTKITLKSLDEQIFEVDEKTARQCGLINDMFLPYEDKKQDMELDEIPLPNVRSDILKRIINYMDHYKDQPYGTFDDDDNSSLSSDSDSDEEFSVQKSLTLDDFNTEFFEPLEYDHATLFSLLNAAHYMQVTKLLDNGCTFLASLMKGLTPEQLREKFNLPDDLSEEEKIRIREENKWAECLR